PKNSLQDGNVCFLQYGKERLWDPSYLKDKCKELNLEEEYRIYQIRMMISYLGVFFMLHISITLVHITYLVAFFFVQRMLFYFVEVVITLSSAAATLICLSINFRENFVIRHRWVMVTSSVLATIISMSGGEFEKRHCFYAELNGWDLTNLRETYIICMIYMFLPISSTIAAIILASLVAVSYMSYFVIYLNIHHYYIDEDSEDWAFSSSDIFHYLCFNIMGIFFRMINDTMVRSSFLDRHQFMIEEFWLRNARLQENLLLNSILPKQIAKSIQMGIKERIVQTDQGLTYDRSRMRTSHVMALQIHPDVSILYADVVNYTHLTTTLTVQKLVKVLHDLYGRFDMAASLFRVQRIKFLGDCYYCVAGLTQFDPDHAKCAVSLGISMIAHIQEVREERHLNIDMRIGVHSGNLIAGVIGEAKLQYDIWGPDVIIASHLESTGEPGCVHISGRTLSNLNAQEYSIMPGTAKAKEDPILQKSIMDTYLITGWLGRESDTVNINNYDSKFSFELKSRPLEHSPSIGGQLLVDELREEFRKMPVVGFRSNCCRRRFNKNTKMQESNIGKICAAFKDTQLERDYLRRPDYMFKYSLLLAWLIGCCLVYIQTVVRKKHCVLSILTDVGVIFYLSFLNCTAWYKTFCHWKSKHNRSKMYGKFSCRVFRLYDRIQESMWNRIVIYLSIIAVYYAVVALIMVSICDRRTFEMNFIESFIFNYEMDWNLCFNPWAITNMMALIVSLSYTFARIPFALKTLIAVVQTFVYAVIMFFEFDYIFYHSASTSAFLRADVAHIMRVVVTLVTFYLKQRQIEFITKTNFKINVDLQKKQQSASITNQSIIILLNNILPAHVVDVYITTLANHELYYENYSMVSVMFAMLINFQMDLPSLRVLNDIISEFDRMLTMYREYFLVEKIKVVGCTYMAACGLDYNLASQIRMTANLANNSEVESVGSTDSFDELRKHDEVVFVMTTFALDLMRTLSECNKAYAVHPFDRALSCGEICIGISSGEIMAGVVGASQPHYDIWGHAVNMASRMQSTGVAGNIQITSESANILNEYGIKTTPRGLTFVKGVGSIPTFFVDIDENLQFVP
ncbi:hypothetical protein KR009_009971, partial [Drosophila setifemur]